jgi:uncharacterized protein (UPF0548 family)
MKMNKEQEILSSITNEYNIQQAQDTYLKGMENILESDATEAVKRERIINYLKQTYAMNRHQAYEEATRVLSNWKLFRNSSFKIVSSSSITVTLNTNAK